MCYSHHSIRLNSYRPTRSSWQSETTLWMRGSALALSIVAGARMLWLPNILAKFGAILPAELGILTGKIGLNQE